MPANTIIKTAIILAAGKGTRLRSVTGDEFPKPLTPIDNQPVIEYSIDALINSGVKRILIGCGHLLESFQYLTEKYDEVEIVENPKYDILASIYTLLILEPYVEEPFYLLEADILYDPKIFQRLSLDQNSQNKIVTSTPLSLDDNVYYRSENGNLVQLTKKQMGEKPEGVMTGIWALSAGILQRFSEYCSRLQIDYSEDYEVMLAQFSSEVEPIEIVHIPDLNWCEIDNEDHLKYAQTQVLPQIKNHSQ
jgi:2-aminoethylphosphonate-pyruvate transaminase